MAIFTFLVMFVAFPETSAQTILLYRARRIRKRFEDQRYISQAEIDGTRFKLSSLQVITNALIRPFQITLLDPAVLPRFSRTFIVPIAMVFITASSKPFRLFTQTCMVSV